MGRRGTRRRGRPTGPTRTGVPGARTRAARRHGRRWTQLLPILAIILLAGLVAPSLVDRLTPGCQHGVTLRVAVAPQAAPVVAEAARRLERSDRRVRGRCVQVDAHTAQPSEVADALRGHGDPLRPRPDVWVPDSSMWVSLVRADPAGVHRLPPENLSIARSPVVIVMPRPDAEARGWPQRPLRWSGLAAAVTAAGGADTARPSVRLGVADPAVSAAGLAGLVSMVQAAAEQSPSWDAEDRAAFLLALRRNVVAEGADPEGLLAEGASAFPAFEHSVWRINSRRPAVPVVAVYPADGSPAADFPFVILSAARDDPETRAAADLLLDVLAGPRTRAGLSAHGLRAPSGRAGAFARAAGLRLDPPGRLPAPDGEMLAETLRLWGVAGRHGRVLAVLDVSGSMGETVPGTGRTRIELARAAAAEAVRLFDEGSELGLWEFSAQVDGDRDYRELLATGPLEQRVGAGTRLEAALRMLGRLQPTPGAGTGLYDTALAAFRDANADYTPGVLNAVVLLTDGRNDDPDSIGREELLAAVRSEFDPDKPVQFVTIGFGSQAEADVLAELAGTTGGRSYVSRDPADIRAAVLDALTRS